MSAYKALKDVSNKFENDLRKVSTELFCAKIGEKFEDVLAKKMRDMQLFTSKLKLLRAKPMSLTPQIKEQLQDNALQEYGDAASLKVLEQMTVKSLTQAHAVKALITAPENSLDPELVGRKKAIIEYLYQFRQKETQLRHFDDIVREKEDELTSLRTEWDQIVGSLRDATEKQDHDNIEDRGPLYPKLSKIVDKLELMRWLVGQLVCSRGRYDWLADPHHRLAALALTRAHNTIETFTQD